MKKLPRVSIWVLKLISNISMAGAAIFFRLSITEQTYIRKPIKFYTPKSLFQKILQVTYCRYETKIKWCINQAFYVTKLTYFCSKTDEYQTRKASTACSQISICKWKFSFSIILPYCYSYTNFYITLIFIW